MSRRSKGDGVGAYATGDGRFRAELVIGWRPDGRPIRKSYYGPTKAAANALLRSAIADRDNGILTASKSPTLLAWLEHWLENIAAPDLKTNTISGYRSYIKGYIRPRAIGNIRLDKLTAEHLDSLYGEMRKLGRSETTVLQMHRILSRALKVAVQRGRVGYNVATRLDAPTAAEFDPTLLSPDDARSLVALARTRPDGASWMVALALGLRQGERLALAWDKIDLEACTMAVHRGLIRKPWEHGCDDVTACTRDRHHMAKGCSKHEKACPKPCPAGCEAHSAQCPERVGGGLKIETPKSRAGKRVIGIPAPLVEVLREHRLAQSRIRVEEGDRWQGFRDEDGQLLDLVFCQRNGRPINPRADWGAWKAFLAEAGVPEVRVHDARHTAATVLLLLGVDGRVVMELMGWSQASMLLRYQHVLDEMKKQAAEAVGGALFSAPTPPPIEESFGVISMADFRKRRQA